MTDETRRLLRECAVDLIRASDLTDEAALHRVKIVQNLLDDIRAEMDDRVMHAQVRYARFAA